VVSRKVVSGKFFFHGGAVVWLTASYIRLSPVSFCMVLSFSFFFLKL
jgi:hypothetical protein